MIWYSYSAQVFDHSHKAKNCYMHPPSRLQAGKMASKSRYIESKSRAVTRDSWLAIA